MTQSVFLSARRVLARLLRDRSGAGLMMGLFAIPAILLFGIVTLDLAQLRMLHMRAQSAADAAALAGALSARDDVSAAAVIAERVFDANMADAAPAAARRAFSAAVATAGDEDFYVVTATLEAELLLAGVSGALGDLGKTRDRVAVTARATLPKKETGPLEMAVVVDNSYAANIGLIELPNVSKSHWQKQYAQVAIDALFEGKATHPDRAVAVIPYAGMVNGARANGLRLTGVAARDADGPYAPSRWKGCLVERGGALDMAPPASRPFARFFAPPRPFINWWRGFFGSVNEGPRKLTERGPNLGCPSEMMPLTRSRAQAMWAVNRMDAWHRGGGVSAIGMTWGRRLLDPRWAGVLLYPDTGAVQAPGLPSGDARKLILLLSTGEDYFFAQDATGLGRRAAPVRADQLDDYFNAACAAAKADGVAIVTVKLWPSSERSRWVNMTSCASDPATGAINSALWPGFVQFFNRVPAVSRQTAKDRIRDAIRAFIDADPGSGSGRGDPYPRLVL